MAGGEGGLFQNWEQGLPLPQGRLGMGGDLRMVPTAPSQIGHLQGDLRVQNAEGKILPRVACGIGGGFR